MINQTLPFQWQWKYNVYIVRIIYIFCFLTILAYFLDSNPKSLHTVTSSLSFLVFVTEGILAGGNIKNEYKQRSVNLKHRKLVIFVHVLLNSLGLLFSVLGFFLRPTSSIISIHYIFGMLALVFQFLTGGLGILKYFQFSNLNIRIYHDIFGFLTFMFGIFSVASGIRTFYFFKKLHQSLLLCDAIILYLIILLFAMVFLLFREDHIDFWSFSRRKKEQILIEERTLPGLIVGQVNSDSFSSVDYDDLDDVN